MDNVVIEDILSPEEQIKLALDYVKADDASRDAWNVAREKTDAAKVADIVVGNLKDKLANLLLSKELESMAFALGDYVLVVRRLSAWGAKYVSIEKCPLMADPNP